MSGKRCFVNDARSEFETRAVAVDHARRAFKIIEWSARSRKICTDRSSGNVCFSAANASCEHAKPASRDALWARAAKRLTLCFGAQRCGSLRAPCARKRAHCAQLHGIEQVRSGSLRRAQSARDSRTLGACQRLEISCRTKIRLPIWNGYVRGGGNDGFGGLPGSS